MAYQIGAELVIVNQQLTERDSIASLVIRLGIGAHYAWCAGREEAVLELSAPAADRLVEKFQSTEKCSGMSLDVGISGIYLNAYP